MTHGQEKSDSLIVAGKRANNAKIATAEPVERRGEAEGNTGRQSTPRTQGRAGVSQALDRVRQAARQRKDERFTALLHHVTVDLLRTAYYGLKREAAPGIDGVTWQAYGEGLEANLEALHDRVHRGSYRARPVRRRYIPKADGRKRPLGIAALEDKIVQRAVIEVLNAIYEEDFLGFSYGFRPGRNQHDALDALAVAITTRKVSFILDADIRAFFDTVSHDWLIRFLEHRIGDRRVLRLIRKWLKAGTLEAGSIAVAPAGTPQGAVISPLLANVYLHYTFDLWAARWRRRAARGEVILVRYADDIVAGFQYQDDAKRFRAELEARLEAFALAVNPDKTRLIEFGRFAAETRKRRGLGKPETFTFLGFTHICSRCRRGRFQLKRRSCRKRQRAKLRAIKNDLRRQMHRPIGQQGRWLRQVVSGYFAYHAVPGNFTSLGAFRYHVIDLWRRELRRRGQKRPMTWARLTPVAERWLPRPRTLHPWPSERFAVKHPRQEPYAGIPLVRICAGGAG